MSLFSLLDYSTVNAEDLLYLKTHVFFMNKAMLNDLIIQNEFRLPYQQDDGDLILYNDCREGYEYNFFLKQYNFLEKCNEKLSIYIDSIVHNIEILKLAFNGSLNQQRLEEMKKMEGKKDNSFNDLLKQFKSNDMHISSVYIYLKNKIDAYHSRIKYIKDLHHLWVLEKNINAYYDDPDKYFFYNCIDAIRNDSLSKMQSFYELWQKKDVLNLTVSQEIHSMIQQTEKKEDFFLVDYIKNNNFLCQIENDSQSAI